MLNELLGDYFQQGVTLVEIYKCKFLKIVNPLEETMLTFAIDLVLKDKFLNVTASGKNGSGVFFKMTALYTCN